MPIYSLEKVPVAKITDLGREDEVRLIEYFRNRNVPLVLGGSNADQVKNYRKNFYVIIGYADVAVQALHNHITQNTDLIYTVINDNKVVYADTNYKDIDLNIVETEFVESDFVIDNEIIPIEISRGCIFKCKFCNYGHIGKKPGTYIRSKESIKSDIQRAYAQYGIKDYLFVDDTFNDSIEKMQMIKEIREELNIPFNFWAYGRLDLLAAHPEMIELMGEIGWTAVTFGVETLNKQSGASVGKGANPERLKNTLLLLKEKYPKLHVQVNLIIGLPHSTKEDIKLIGS
jgi:radical SAM superfamily enzyme YgiQ (UPF0313 family)